MTSFVDEQFPLSPQQLLLANADPARANATLALGLEGTVDAQKTAAILSEMVHRHEIFRIQPKQVEGNTVQLIAEQEDQGLSLKQTSFSGTDDELAALIAEPVSMDTNWCRLHAHLISRKENTHVLVLTLPAFCADRTTLHLVVDEFLAAMTSGAVSQEDPEWQYVDLAEWLNSLLEKPIADQGRAFWQAERARNTSLTLPLEQTLDGNPFQPASYRWTLPNPAGNQDLKHFLLTCWWGLLRRYSEDDAVTLHVAANGRHVGELANVPGPLTRYLPITIEMTQDTAFQSIHDRVTAAVNEAAKWTDYLTQDPDNPTSPRLGFNYLDQKPLPICPGLQCTVLAEQDNTLPFKLNLQLRRTTQGIDANLVYNAVLMDAALVASMANAFTTTVAHFNTDREAALDEAAPMDTALWSKHTEADPTPTPFTADGPFIHERFADMANKHGRHYALIVNRPDGTEEKLTYRELQLRADPLAAYLGSLGVGPETQVAVCMERCADLVVSLLAVLQSGAAYVAIDPKYPVDRIAFMLEDSAAPVLLTNSVLAPRLPETSARVVCLDEVTLEDAPAPKQLAQAENAAYVIYTSGSTGKPKGVMIPHRAVRAMIQWAVTVFSEEQRRTVLASTSVCFDLSIFELFLPLTTGATVVLIENLLHLPQAPAKDQVSLINTVPSAISELLNMMDLPPSVNTVNLAGEAFQQSLVHRVYQQPAVKHMYNLYGPSEDTTYSTVALMDKEAATPDIGRPISGSQLYIVNARLNPVPIGVPGELLMGGHGLSRGYAKRPGMTAERFIPNPFVGVDQEGSRLYRTGDLARLLPNGKVDFLGRIDHQIKLKGYRIELGEIEARLCELTSVEKALVMARDDAAVGGGSRLVAYLQAPAAEPEWEQEVLAHMRDKLPHYMVPSAFVRLDAYPLTPNGKIDRKALPSPAGKRVRKNLKEATTPEEQRLAEILADLLGLEQVGIDEEFLSIGGDSIISIQASARARQKGFQFAPGDLFKYPTVEKLAPNMAPVAPTQAEQEMVTGNMPLMPIQHWFFETDIADRHIWNQSIFMTVAPNLDADSLRKAFKALLEQHDALRMRYDMQRGMPVQSFAPQTAVAEACMHCEDYTAMDETARRQALTQATEHYQQSLAPEKGEMLRLVWFNYGPQTPGRLLLTIHHLVVDGVSWRVLLEDLFRAYSQAAAGERCHLPEKTSSYKAWSEALTAYSGSPELAEERDYWAALADAPAAVPLDRDATHNLPVGEDAMCVAGLSEEETRALLQDVPPVYRTEINDVLLAALLLSFGKWSGNYDLFLELEGHGREQLFDQLDVSRTVGWFTTLFPLRLSVTDTQPGHVLKTVKESMRAIPHNGIGYGVLRYLSEDATVRETMARVPRAKVIFNYLGRLDQVLPKHELNPNIAAEEEGRTRGVHQQRPHLLDFGAVISDGVLQLNCRYSPSCHDQTTVKSLCQGFTDALRSLIQHCQSLERGGLTPSDVSGVTMTQQELDALDTATRHRGKSNLESVHPLSPIQMGILFHTVMAPGSGVYVLQRAYDLDGLDLQAFKNTWELIIEGIGIFRTGFFNLETDKPLQVVLNQVPLPWHQEDWRDLPEQERETRFEALLVKDRKQGFDFSKPPIMRFYMLQLGEDHYRFVWSHQHILLDGWSNAIVMEYLVRIYESLHSGLAPPPIHTRPYSEYVQWLGRHDMSQSETWWRAYLKGITTPTPLNFEAHNPESGKLTEAQYEIDRDLSQPAVDALDDLLKQEKVTLNVVAQAAWALLLSRYARQRDIVFGSTVSGRPFDLEGVERMVGPFINTVPVRTQIAEDRTLLSWLKEMQTDQMNRGSYEFIPLSELRRFTSIHAGLPFLETNLVVENYPVSAEITARSDDDVTVKITPRALIPQNSFPITITIRPRNDHKLLLRYDTNRFTQPTMERVLKEFATLMETMITKPESRVRDLTIGAVGEKKKMAKDKLKKKKSKFKGLRDVRRDEVDLNAIEPVAYGFLALDEKVPLVVTPNSDNLSLGAWAGANRQLIEDKLHQHGAVLFRNFNVNNVTRFHEFASAVCDDLLGDYGDLPPEKENQRVYHSTPYPEDKSILFHNESSHTHRWPMKQFFGSMIVAETGGQTPIVDCREVYNHLDPAIIKRIEEKKLMYVRNFIDALDVSWQQFFRTEDKAVVDAKCRATGMETHWDGNELRTSRICRGTSLHPKTREPVFFNQIQLHHIACLDEDERESILGVYSREKLPRNVYFGDGSDIDDSIVKEITDCYWELSKSFPWQVGDVLMVDNMLTAHARLPFSGPRKIVVAMGEIVTEDKIDIVGA